MKFGLHVINTWNGSEGVENGSRFLVELAVEAEKAGWDGLFLWDHLLFPWEVSLIEPWAVLSAIAARTTRLKLGTAVTPIPRRRPQVLAKQLVTLDHLSNGRAILSVGLGGTEHEYTPFGEKFDYKLLAEKADEALQIVVGLWSGKPFIFKGKHYTADNVTFLPKPIQEPRIPIWVGGASEGAVRRASRYDGWAIGGPCPSAKEEGLSLEQVSKAKKRVMKYRGGDRRFDIQYSLEFPTDKNQLEELVGQADSAGVTWMCESLFGWRCNGKQAFNIVRQGPPKV
jgi:alkanesulfonate monooxygenase SsuD/methylene tetrahydromethanopterin reductase-like flavin-dependent oxidoreductase (luciferase family)